MSSLGPGVESLGAPQVDNPTTAHNEPVLLTATTSVPAKSEAGNDMVSCTLVLAQNGTLAVRDFGFEKTDARHAGHGSVLPARNEHPVYVVLYDFRAESSNELSVAAGTQLHYLRAVDAGWALAQRVDDPTQRGLVPEAYVAKT